MVQNCNFNRWELHNLNKSMQMDPWRRSRRTRRVPEEELPGNSFARMICLGLAVTLSLCICRFLIQVLGLNHQPQNFIRLRRQGLLPFRLSEGSVGSVSEIDNPLRSD